LKIQEAKGKKLRDFEVGLYENSDVVVLRKDVQAFAIGFGYPGL